MSACVTLRDGTLTARFVPAAGMVGASLTDDGVELLGMGKTRRGLDEYRRHGEFFGLPIMHPWANRLGSWEYTAEGATVTLTPGRPDVHSDENGLAIHGLLTACPQWRVETVSEDEVLAGLDFGAHPDLLSGFPFPHRIAVRIAVRHRRLEVTTSVTATGDVAVPLCFGFHPYLVIPEAPRAEWIVETPAMRHLGLDALSLPTGEWRRQPAEAVVLGDRVYDDGYDEVAEGAVFAVSGGGRRIEVQFDRGYPCAQIYAPADQDTVCFEPMTAPTDALRRGGYRIALPGTTEEAVFSIQL